MRPPIFFSSLPPSKTRIKNSRSGTAPSSRSAAGAHYRGRDNPFKICGHLGNLPGPTSNRDLFLFHPSLPLSLPPPSFFSFNTFFTTSTVTRTFPISCLYLHQVLGSRGFESFFPIGMWDVITSRMLCLRVRVPSPRLPNDPNYRGHCHQSYEQHKYRYAYLAITRKNTFSVDGIRRGRGEKEKK